MRAVGCVGCATLIAMACGRASGGDDRESGQGGMMSQQGGAGALQGGAPADTGGSASSGGPAGGRDFETGGRASAGGSGGGGGSVRGGSSNGGIPASGGSHPDAGSSGSGGTAVAGDAGAAGQAGAPSCESFLACGCGCCGGTKPSATQCHYPEVPDDLATVMAEDEAVRQNLECGATGCSQGVLYACCDAAERDSASATYSATGVPGGYDRLHISKAGSDSCGQVTLVNSSSLSRFRTALELPGGWWFEAGRDAPCSVSSVTSNAIGASGSVRARPEGAACVLDIHMTLFVHSNDELRKVRFDADGVTLSGATGVRCQ